MKFFLRLCLICFVLFCSRPSPSSAQEVVDISLLDAIEIALEHNEDIDEGFAQISSARAAVLSAKGAYDLTLYSNTRFSSFENLAEEDYPITALTNASTDYFKIDTGISQRLPTGASVNIYHTYSLEHMLGAFNSPTRQSRNYFTIEFTQSLLKGFADKETRGAIENALLAVDDALQGRNLIISQVVYSVVANYWSLKLAQKNIEVTKEVLDMALEVLRRENARFVSGLSQGVDVDRAEMAVEQRRYNYVSAQRDFQVAQERLARVVNYPNYSTSLIFNPTSEPSAEVQKLPNAENFEANAITNRYELKQLKIMLEQLNVTYDINKNKMLPTLDFVAGYTTANGNDYLRGSENFKTTSEKPSFYVGVNFAYPLQNRTALGEKRVSEKLIYIAQVRAEKMRNTIRSEVNEVMHNLELAKTGIPIAKRAYQEAKDVLFGENKRFEMGGINNRDLLAAHDALGREQLNYYTALISQALANAQYSYVSSELLQKHLVSVTEESAEILKY